MLEFTNSIQENEVIDNQLKFIKIEIHNNDNKKNSKKCEEDEYDYENETINVPNVNVSGIKNPKFPKMVNENKMRDENNFKKKEKNFKKTDSIQNYFYRSIDTNNEGIEINWLKNIKKNAKLDNEIIKSSEENINDDIDINDSVNHKIKTPNINLIKNVNPLLTKNFCENKNENDYIDININYDLCYNKYSDNIKRFSNNKKNLDKNNSYNDNQLKNVNKGGNKKILQEKIYKCNNLNKVSNNENKINIFEKNSKKSRSFEFKKEIENFFKNTFEEDKIKETLILNSEEIREFIKFKDWKNRFGNFMDKIRKLTKRFYTIISLINQSYNWIKKRYLGDNLKRIKKSYKLKKEM